MIGAFLIISVRLISISAAVTQTGADQSMWRIVSRIIHLCSVGNISHCPSFSYLGGNNGLMKLGVPCRHIELHTPTQMSETSNNTQTHRDLCRRMQTLSFIRLSVRLIHLDSAAAHPGNFQVVLSSSTRVFSLIWTIQDRVRIQTSKVEVFRSRIPTEAARLPPQSCLEKCGFKGGPEESPAEATVYYDYTLLFTDCPILNCDHYFRSKPDSAARHTVNGL